MLQNTGGHERMTEFRADKRVLQNTPLDDYHVLNCSFGKDSMAMLKMCYDRGYPIDEVCYIDIRYDSKHSAEYPEHEKWIHEVGIPYITETLNLPFKSINPPVTYKELFFRKFQKGIHAGQCYGFSVRRTPKCNSLKVSAMKEHALELMKNNKNVIKYVGIAADEVKRIQGAYKRGEKLPLVEMNITERECFKICKDEGILSPIYSHSYFNRIGCFFCPYSNIDQFRHVYKTSPELMRDLAELDKYSPFKFHPPYTATELLRKFESEEREQKPLTIFAEINT
jgi:3'-phosphoadenosine 5'-phosphosulfate sulfotransferase (PAPS reductase)/FAD synthetase